ncbi:MAG TPA: NADH-quinone oxidoreductase subunit C, partial [Bacilli bacterium]|nr:NADH-quinone oxidoreductase subunit C [Bacilli bacterium]
AAAAKAKAAALAKAKSSEEASGDDGDEKARAIAAAKAKAVAAAKAKAAALAKAKAEGSGEASGDDGDAKAKAIAAAKAKAAAVAAAKAKVGAGKGAASKEVEEEKPSHHQPILDKYLQVLKENLGDDVLEDAYINRAAKHVPTIVVKREHYFKVAQFLKHNEQLAFDYLSTSHATDYETYMEIYNHFYSFKTKENIAMKVKIDRENPEIESLVSIWEGANWPEREMYDLLGIVFTGHPNLKRILLPDDWVGYPLRKDYEPHDEGV